MNQKQLNWVFWLLPLLSSLFWAAFVIKPLFHSFALIYCFVPIWYFWFKTTSLRRVVFAAWLTQFLASCLIFYWLRYTAFLFFGFEGISSWIFLLVFATVANLQLPIVGLIWFWLRRKYLLNFNQSMILLIVLSSFFEAVWPRMFPFSLGHGWFFVKWPIYQWADVTGFKWLSAINFVLQGLLCTLLITPSKRTKGLMAISALSLFILATVSGQMRSQFWKNTDSTVKLHVYQSFIKPVEILSQEIGANEALDFTLNYYLKNQEDFSTSKEKPDVIIWSETAMPFDVEGTNKYVDGLKQFVKQMSIPLITGSYRYDSNHRKYNSIAFFDKNGNYANHYNKHILMPFGEYLPGEEFFPILRKLAPQIPNYGSTLTKTSFTVNNAKFSPSICYESLFSGYIRDLVKENTNILLNITSDVWFGPDLEPEQHNLLATSLAVEFRRPIIRSADSGISSIVSATGEVIAESPIWNEWRKTLTLNFLENPPNTLFLRYGEYYNIAGAILLIALIGLFIRNGRRNLNNE